MAKQSILNRLARAVGNVTVGHRTSADLMDARSRAEAALTTAERLHRKAALEAHEGAPGAAQRLIEAAASLRGAQEQLRDVMAAQIELEAVNQERQRQARMAAEAAADEDTGEEMDALDTVAQKLQEAIGPFCDAWEHYTAAHRRTADLHSRCPRMRRDRSLGISVETLVATEIARVGNPENLPPGHAGFLSGNYDPRELTPLATAVKQFTDGVRGDLAKAAAKRAAQ